LIEGKVGKLIGRHGFRDSDLEDLQQDLALHWIPRAKRHDARRASLATYADRALNSRVIDLVRHAHALKRQGREWTIDDVPEDLLAAAAQSAVHDLAIDVWAALADLTGRAREVALLLMVLPEAGVVRATGMSRQRVRGLKRRIERQLRGRGLP
jgi:hypothetical protein